MHIFMATDIFGRTDATERLAQQLSEREASVTILTPYEDQAFRRFPDERAAYSAFLDECGHARYADKVLTSMQTTQDRVIVIGFSAGASAIWKVSEDTAKPGAASYHWILSQSNS